MPWSIFKPVKLHMVSRHNPRTKEKIAHKTMYSPTYTRDAIACYTNIGVYGFMFLLFLLLLIPIIAVVFWWGQTTKFRYLRVTLFLLLASTTIVQMVRCGVLIAMDTVMLTLDSQGSLTYHILYSCSWFLGFIQNVLIFYTIALTGKLVHMMTEPTTSYPGVVNVLGTISKIHAFLYALVEIPAIFALVGMKFGFFAWNVTLASTIISLALPGSMLLNLLIQLGILTVYLTLAFISPDDEVVQRRSWLICALAPLLGLFSIMDVCIHAAWTLQNFWIYTYPILGFSNCVVIALLLISVLLVYQPIRWTVFAYKPSEEEEDLDEELKEQAMKSQQQQGSTELELKPMGRKKSLVEFVNSLQIPPTNYSALPDPDRPPTMTSARRRNPLPLFWNYNEVEVNEV